MDATTLRVIDFGSVSPLRSQTLWHAIARGVSAGAPPTLSFMRPDAPYVSIGYHRRLDEVDREECRRRGLPVFRRMVGGGPVYIDDGQLFFQITVPAGRAPAVRGRALRTLLQPAVDAFRDVGVAASLEDQGDIVVEDRKISGHGAGQIEQAVIVVANLITRFDHGAAAHIMAAPDAATTRALEAMMRRYVAATPVPLGQFTAAVVRRYADALGLDPAPSGLTDVEDAALAALDAEFVDDDWLAGTARSVPPVWRVKIKAGVHVAHAVGDGARVRLSVAHGRIVDALFVDPALNGVAEGLARAARGETPAETRDRLGAAGYGRLAELVGAMERGR